MYEIRVDCHSFLVLLSCFPGCCLLLFSDWFFEGVLRCLKKYPKILGEIS